MLPDKDGQRDPDAKLQSLIDIQNRVKDNEISMDEAVNLFREWEESHNHTQSMSTVSKACSHGRIFLI